MKNIIYKLLVLCISISLLSGCSIENESNITVSNDLIEVEHSEISNKLIRFHVLANSNSDEDQALKLKVRDVVIEKMSNKLSVSESMEESRKILEENSEEVINIAKDVIKEQGFDYDVDVELGRYNFPDKVYGDYIFEQGEYEAFKIIIGSGQGENWWCVMFPPLCFVDESKEVIDSEILKENLSNSEEDKNEENVNSNEEVDDLEKISGGQEEDYEIEFSFKIIEFIKDLFK